ncbi:Dehydrogenase/reductase SDR family member 12 [Hypsibius exemplaris]|uniref:Dehydrogenase/reductase SDR family member 12 n=1 Tax=Hypsibius exemplaris TaxID=2072580 RepID=A0A9X6NHK3_HYPEX|nr:Dehydrogenase/reductase SDR family member 12 [Hypsibius exemplaris]
MIIFNIRRNVRRHTSFPSQPGRFVLIFGGSYITLLILFVTYGFLFLTDLRYSYFYDTSGQNLLQTKRDAGNEASAAKFIEQLINQGPALSETMHDPAISPPRVDLCAVVVTVPRKRRYLYQTLASILLSNCEDGSSCSHLSTTIPALKLHVLYTHSAPHSDFEALVKAKMPQLLPLNKPKDSDSNWYKAELSDYSSALKFCYEEYKEMRIKARTTENRTHLTLILEDDVIATRRVFDKMLQGVETLEGENDWLLVRLYRSAYWDGWEKNDWSVLIALGCLGGVIDIGFYSCVPVIIMMVVSGLITVCVLLMLNRQNLPFLWERAGLHEDDASAGTLAVLYSTPRLAGLLEFLDSTSIGKETPIDVALNEFVAKTGLKQFHLVPDLFDHRGVFSSGAGKNDGTYEFMKVSSSFVDEVDVNVASPPHVNASRTWPSNQATMTLYRNSVFSAKGMLEFTKGGFNRAKMSFKDQEMSSSCEDKIFLVTGANNGIGRATAADFARRGGTVHLVCRNEERCAEAAASFRKINPKANIFEHTVDMSVCQEVQDFTERFNKVFGKVDVLVNNAGVLLNERTETEGNHLEKSFATNVLGTYACTVGLLPSLEKSEDPRVITVSSGGMYLEKLDLSDLQSERSFDGSRAYSQQKRQQVVMMEQFAMKHPGILFLSMHPGWVDTPGVQTSLPTFHKLLHSFLRSPEEGADTTVWLATIPRTHAALHNGAFYFDRKEAAKHLPLAWTRSSPHEDAQLTSILGDFLLKGSSKP